MIRIQSVAVYKQINQNWWIEVIFLWLRNMNSFCYLCFWSTWFLLEIVFLTLKFIESFLKINIFFFIAYSVSLAL